MLNRTQDMAEPKTYYEVPVQIGKEHHKATFFEGENGQFDLLYGWAAYTTSMSSTLGGAIADFKKHVEQSHPGEDVIVGKPFQITKVQAKQNSPNFGR